LQCPPKENEQRVPRRMRLVMPEVEMTRPHRKLNGVPFVQANSTSQEVNREAGDKN